MSLKMCCLLFSCFSICVFVFLKVILCLPFLNTYVCDILGFHFAYINLLKYVCNVCEGLLSVFLSGLTRCLSFWVYYLLFIYFEGQLFVDYLFVYLFLRVYV